MADTVSEPNKGSDYLDKTDKVVWIAFVALLVFLAAVIGIPELKTRKMANNQTSAAAACKAFAEAEELYRRIDHDCDGVLEYAQSLQELARVGLLSQDFADAELENGLERPRNGYLFKVLTSQGPKATGGARHYITGTNMTLGYGLVASPAIYDGTGRDTFVISNNGTIFQKDRGEAETLQRLPNDFNPPSSWDPDYSPE